MSVVAGMEFSKGRFRVRLAGSSRDLEAVQRLRSRSFRGGTEADADEFDARCQHLMIERLGDDQLVGTCRWQVLGGAEVTGGSYTAQFYDLEAMARQFDRMMEVGRFCMEGADTDGLRLAWAALTRIVDGEGVGMMFGCSSFPGTLVEPHAEAFAALATGYLAPLCLRPGRRAVEVVPLAARPHDPRRAMLQMPPLLRSYLAMGGWVSDHAVVDRDLGTLHVMTGVEIAAIPPVRARLLRADAA